MPERPWLVIVRDAADPSVMTGERYGSFGSEGTAVRAARDYVIEMGRFIGSNPEAMVRHRHWQVCSNGERVRAFRRDWSQTLDEQGGRSVLVEEFDLPIRVCELRR